MLVDVLCWLQEEPRKSAELAMLEVGDEVGKVLPQWSHQFIPAKN